MFENELKTKLPELILSTCADNRRSADENPVMPGALALLKNTKTKRFTPFLYYSVDYQERAKRAEKVWRPFQLPGFTRRPRRNDSYPNHWFIHQRVSSWSSKADQIWTMQQLRRLRIIDKRRAQLYKPSSKSQPFDIGRLRLVSIKMHSLSASHVAGLWESQTFLLATCSLRFSNVLANNWMLSCFERLCAKRRSWSTIDF